MTTDKAAALKHLEPFHRMAVAELGFGWENLATPEQVHGDGIATIDSARPDPRPSPGIDGLLTSNWGALLGIYVADCAPVFLVDPVTRSLGPSPLRAEGQRAGDHGQGGRAPGVGVRCPALRPHRPGRPLHPSAALRGRSRLAHPRFRARRRGAGGRVSRLRDLHGRTLRSVLFLPDGARGDGADACATRMACAVPGTGPRPPLGPRAWPALPPPRAGRSRRLPAPRPGSRRRDRWGRRVRRWGFQSRRRDA